MNQKVTLFLFTDQFFRLNKKIDCSELGDDLHTLASLKVNKELFLEDEDSDGFLYEFEIEVDTEIWLTCLLQSLDGNTDSSWIGETVIFTKRHEFHDFLKGL